LWATAFGLAASVPPFGTVAFEVWAPRTGRRDADRTAVGRTPEPALD
jgi:hypothetical protein